MILFQPCHGAVAHIGIVSAHLPHCIEIYSSVVDSTLRHVTVDVLSVVAAWLAVNIDGCVGSLEFLGSDSGSSYQAYYQQTERPDRRLPVLRVFALKTTSFPDWCGEESSKPDNADPSSLLHLLLGLSLALVGASRHIEAALSFHRRA